MEVVTIYTCEAHVAKLDEYHDFYSCFANLGRWERPQDPNPSFELACERYRKENPRSGLLGFKFVKIPVLTLVITTVDSKRYFDLTKLEVDVKGK